MQFGSNQIANQIKSSRAAFAGSGSGNAIKWNANEEEDSVGLAAAPFSVPLRSLLGAQKMEMSESPFVSCRESNTHTDKQFNPMRRPGLAGF